MVCNHVVVNEPKRNGNKEAIISQSLSVIMLFEIFQMNIVVENCACWITLEVKNIGAIVYSIITKSDIPANRLKKEQWKLIQKFILILIGAKMGVTVT